MNRPLPACYDDLADARNSLAGRSSRAPHALRITDYGLRITNPPINHQPSLQCPPIPRYPRYLFSVYFMLDDEQKALLIVVINPNAELFGP